MSASVVRSSTAGPTRRRWHDLLPPLVAVWAAVHTLLGCYWLLRPDAWPFHASKIPGSVMQYLDPRLGAGLFTVFALAGLVVALAMRRANVPTWLRRSLLTTAVLQAIVFTVAVPDSRAITYLGYLTALATPAAVVVLAVVGSVRHWRIRLLALALVAVGTLGVLTGWIDTDIIREISAGLVTGFTRNGLGPLHVFAILAGGAAWAGLAVSYFRRGRGRCGACGRPDARWTHPDVARRWGRWVTIAAICCPVPYALARLTWLTPWPLGFDPAVLASQPGIRLWGLFLGSAAIMGCVLTSGLISRWGERWPFWMPRLAGRRIPLWVAIIPAVAVTFALLAGSEGMTVTTVQAIAAKGIGAVGEAGIFPFAPWAVTLGAATLAYYYRRRGACRTCAAS